MVNCWFGLGWWFGFLESPYEMDCYLSVPQKKISNHRAPNQQFTISRFFGVFSPFFLVKPVGL